MRIYGLIYIASAYFLGAVLPASASTLAIPKFYQEKCSSCHSVPAGTLTPMNFVTPSQMPNWDKKLDSATNLISFLQNSNFSSSMKAAGDDLVSLGTSDTTAETLRLFLLSTRDAIVTKDGNRVNVTTGITHTFPGLVAEGSFSPELVIRVANARGGSISSVLLQPSGLPNNFTVNNNCSSGVGSAALLTPPSHTDINVPECDIRVRFAPKKGTLANVGISGNTSLVVTFASAIPGIPGQTPNTVTYPVQVLGTSAGPPAPLAPVYDAVGFVALANFAVGSGSSQVMCPMISNTAGTLPLNISGLVIENNASGLFSITDVANCPSAGTQPICTATTSLAPNASCRVPIRFTALAGLDGVITGPELRVDHNVPPVTTVRSPLIGTISNVPAPAIGFYSDPGIESSRVRPPTFVGIAVNATSAIWSQLQIVNAGLADGLDILEVSQSNPTQFSLIEDCVSAPPLARVLGRAPFCTVSLRFTPTQTGQQCTTILVRAALTRNDIQKVDVCGTAVAAPRGATLELSSSSIDFGRRQLNAIYPPKVLELRNTANASTFLSVLALTLDGAGFSILPSTGTAGCQAAVLAPGASCKIEVQFVPDPSRPDTPYSAILSVTSNDAQSAHTIALTAVAGGFSPPPVLEYLAGGMPMEFDGFVVVGQAAARNLKLELHNAGPGGAAIQSVRIVGPDASSFRVSACPALLDEGATCVIEIAFLPGSGGIKSAQVEILAGVSVAPALVAITGRAVGSSSAFLATSVAELGFSPIRLGSRSEPMTVRITAGGEGTLTVNSVEVQGPFSVEAVSCPAAPFTLSRGSECSLNVRFVPVSEGAAAGTLLIATDSNPRAKALPLSGNAGAKPETSGGGCSMVDEHAIFDPMLIALTVLALLALNYRRNTRRQAETGKQPW